MFFLDGERVVHIGSRPSPIVPATVIMLVVVMLHVARIPTTSYARLIDVNGLGRHLLLLLLLLLYSMDVSRFVLMHCTPGCGANWTCAKSHQQEKYA